MMRVHRRLQASVEYMVLGDLAQCVLNALHRAGHVQRFTPLGTLSARGAVLVRLRQLGLFQRPGAEGSFEGVLEELLAAGALTVDGDALVLPILSADKLREPRPAARALTPEQAEAATRATRARENFERAYRLWRQKARDAGDARSDAELREEYRASYRPRRGPGQTEGTEGAQADGLPVELPPAEAQNFRGAPEHPPVGLPVGVEVVAPASRVSLSSLSLCSNSQEREGERDSGETPRGREAPAARTSGNAQPEVQRAEVPTVGTTGTSDTPGDFRERATGSATDGSPPAEEPPPAAATLTDAELGALGLGGLARAGAKLADGSSAAQVRELGAWMRAREVPPEQLARAGRFLAGCDIAARYAWDATTVDRGAVTLDFLLGKRTAEGREGARLTTLLQDAAKAKPRATQGQLNLQPGAHARTAPPTAPAAVASPPPAAAGPVLVKLKEVAEAERARAAGEAPRIVERPPWARVQGPAGEGGADTG